MKIETMRKDDSKRCGECKNWNLANKSVFKECNKEVTIGFGSKQGSKFYYTDENICHTGNFEQI